MSVLEQGRREGDFHTRVRATENEAEELLEEGTGVSWGRCVVNKGKRRTKNKCCLKIE